MVRVELYGLRLPEVKPRDDLARLIVEGASREAGGLRDGDVLVIASKVVSKSYGLLIDMRRVKPSKKALRIARKTGMNPRMVQAVLENCDRVLFLIPIKLIADRFLDGFMKLAENPENARRALELIPYMLVVRRGLQVYTDAGLDFSNHPENVASIPPENPDLYARKLRKRIKELSGMDVAVVISDTECFPGIGSIDLARVSVGARTSPTTTGKYARCSSSSSTRGWNCNETAYSPAAPSAGAWNMSSVRALSSLSRASRIGFGGRGFLAFPLGS